MENAKSSACCKLGKTIRKKSREKPDFHREPLMKDFQGFFPFPCQSSQNNECNIDAFAGAAEVPFAEKECSCKSR